MTENTIFSTLQILRPKQLLRSDLVQKVLAALGSRGIVIGLSLLISILVARVLGPEGRGLFGIATAISTLGVQLGLMGFHSANTFHISKNPSLLPVMISNSFLVSLLFGTLTMGLLYCFRHQIQGYAFLPLSLLILCLALVPINICFTLIQGLLTGLHKFKTYNLSEILNKAFYTACILACILFGALSPLTATFFQGVGFVVSILFMIKALSKSYTHLTKPSLSLLKENFFYGGKAYLACFLAWGVMRLDIFILQRFQNLEQVGYFSVALSLIDTLLLFSSVVASILHPKLCIEPDLKKKWALTKKAALGSSLVIFLGATLVILWKAPIQWMFGIQFMPCHKTILYLLPGFILLSLETLFVQFIISIRFPWSLVCIWGIGLGLKFFVSMHLVPILGVKGIGISWFITYFFVFISVLINIKIILKSQSTKLNKLFRIGNSQ